MGIINGGLGQNYGFGARASLDIAGEQGASTTGNKDFLDTLERVIGVVDDAVDIFKGGGNVTSGNIGNQVRQAGGSVVASGISQWFSENWLMLAIGGVAIVAGVILIKKLR